MFCGMRKAWPHSSDTDRAVVLAVSASTNVRRRRPHRSACIGPGDDREAVVGVSPGQTADLVIADCSSPGTIAGGTGAVGESFVETSDLGMLGVSRLQHSSIPTRRCSRATTSPMTGAGHFPRARRPSATVFSTSTRWASSIRHSGAEPERIPAGIRLCGGGGAYGRSARAGEARPHKDGVGSIRPGGDRFPHARRYAPTPLVRALHNGRITRPAVL